MAKLTTANMFQPIVHAEPRGGALIPAGRGIITEKSRFKVNPARPQERVERGPLFESYADAFEAAKAMAAGVKASPLWRFKRTSITLFKVLKREKAVNAKAQLTCQEDVILEDIALEPEVDS